MTTKATTCVVTATKAANGIYDVATGTATFTIAAAAQSTLIISNSVMIATATSSITLTSSGGSGSGTVTFATTTDGCNIDGITLTVTKLTICVVIATKAANGIFAAANSAAVSFTFTAATQSALSISNNPKTGVVGTPTTLTTSGGNGDGAVTYRTTTTGCTITGSQLVASRATTCVVTATKAANGIYASISSAPTQFVFTVAVALKVAAKLLS